MAIKEILERGGSSEARFVREAIITARLEHPSIVPVHDAGRWDDGTPFYSMKFVSGRQLKTLIREAHTQAERLAILPHVIAVAEAIAYAHSNGVIHRDLKPSNIIVGPFGETMVIDWGLARDLAEREGNVEDGSPSFVGDDPRLTMQGAIIGTPAYMAPEQARGGDTDERTDVYSIGAVLYQLLAGALPYDATTSQELLAKIVVGPPTPMTARAPDLPEELCAIVDKAMAREPDQRYANAGMLADDLKRFQAGQLVGAHRYSLRSLALRWARRHRPILAVAALATVALMAFGFASIVRIRAEKSRAEQALFVAQTARRDLEVKNDDLTISNARSRLPFDPTETMHWIENASDSKLEQAETRILALTANASGISDSTAHLSDKNVQALLTFDNGDIVSQQNADFIVVWDSRLHEIARYKVEISVATLRKTEDPTGFAFSPDGRTVSRVAINDAGASAATQYDCGKELTSFDFDSEDGSLYCLKANGEVSHIPVRSNASNAEVLFRSSEIAGPSSNVQYLRAHGSEAALLVITTSDFRSFAWPIGSIRKSPTLLAAPTSTGAFISNGQRLLASQSGEFYDFHGRKLEIPEPRSQAVFRAFAQSPTTENVGLAFSSGEIFLGSGQTWHRFEVPITPSKLAMATSAQWLAVGSDDGEIVIIETATGGWHELRGHVRRVRSLAFSSDESHVISGGDDGWIRSWPVPSIARNVGSAQKTSIEVLDASKEQLVAFGSDKSILVKDAHSDWRRIPNTSVISGYARHPTLPLLATATWDGDVRIWDLSVAGGPISKIVAHHDGVALELTWDEEGIWLASSGIDGSVQLTRTAPGQNVTRHDHHSRVDALAFDRNSHHLISASRDGTVCETAPDDNTATCTSIADDPRSAVALGDLGVVIGTKSGRMYLWEPNTHRAAQLASLPGEFLEFYASREGHLVVANDRGGHVTLFGGPKEAVKSSMPCPGKVANLAIAGDVGMVAASCESGDIWLSNYKSQQQVIVRVPHGEAKSLAFSLDRKLLLTAGSDGAVRGFSIDKMTFVPDNVPLRQWISSQFVTRTGQTK